MRSVSLNGKILSLTKRLRRTPFSSRIKDSVKSVTIYNHMVLPTVFDTLEEDCLHLKNHVQLWDVSVQRQVEISGKDATKLLELLTPRPVSDMDASKCLYIPMVNQKGGMINDPVLLKVDENRFWISIADSDVLLWVSGIAAALNLDVEVSEPAVAPLAVQGPKSRKLLERVFGSEIRDLKYFEVRKFNFGSYSMNIARTGWSKQGGFEIYVEGEEYALDLWDNLIQTGEDLNIRPGCPNQIERIESGLLSYGSDMTTDNTPYECGLLKFIGSEINPSCIGAKALNQARLVGPKKIIRFLDIKGPNIPFCDNKWVAKTDSLKVGEVTSGVFSPEFQKNLGIAMIDIDYSAEGTEIEVLLEQEIRQAIVKEKPFNTKLKAFFE